jgi:hypothetical protein
VGGGEAFAQTCEWLAGGWGRGGGTRGRADARLRPYMRAYIHTHLSVDQNVPPNSTQWSYAQCECGFV